MIGASIPESDAERFDAACDALGITKSQALKTFIYGFIDEHTAEVDRHMADQLRQDRLPVAS
jgi:hypothetical protein